MRTSLLLMLISISAQPQTLEEQGWDRAFVHAVEAKGRHDYAAAQEALSSALASAQSFPAQDLRLAATYELTGDVNVEIGHIRDSESDYLRALSIRERVAPDIIRMSLLLMGLASVYTMTGETSKAEKFARRAIVLREQSLSATDVPLAEPLQRLAAVLQREHRYSEARETYERALNILRESRPEYDVLRASIAGTLGDLLGQMGFVGEGIERLESAIAMASSDAASRPLSLIFFRTTLAELYVRSNRWEEAYRTILEAKDSAEKVFGPEHVSLARILPIYARVLRHMKRGKEASAVERRARAIYEQFSKENGKPDIVEVGDLANRRRR